GMMSLRHNGEQYPSLVGRYLGKGAKGTINIISIVLMILVAAAFTAGPAQLMAQVTPLSFTMSLILIFAYFVLAAILPVNKI
ncbi:carbon starvation protein A, partial [Staphylococcus sp. SIMBA_130]